jgi:DNA repair protein RecO (recombination protein O)
MSVTRVQGIVLRTVDYGEADRIVTFLCREGGKVGAMARAAQKSHKRYAGVLEIGTVVDADLTGSPRKQLYSLTRIDLVRSFMSLGADISAFAFASYALELVREFTPDREGDAALFDLCVHYLESLVQRGPEPWTLHLFELALLGHLGYAPSLSHCHDCRREVRGPCSFHPALGGLRCEACDPEGRGGILLGHHTAPRLLALAREGMSRLESLGKAQERVLPVPFAAPQTPAEERIVREAGRLLGRYIEHQLGRRMKSLAFLEELSR